jgi:NAD(P)H-hydrate repair Nnr-like enzyme with NAD(P)H-hydrate epimerase domain
MKRAKLRQISAVLAASVLAALAASGCSVSYSSGDTAKQADEVSTVKSFIRQKLTDLPATKSVDCPSGVSASGGTTFECTITLVNGQTATIPLQVKSLSGGKIGFISNPNVVDQAEAVALIYANATTAVKSVDCPAGVPLKPGKTFTCKGTFANGHVNVVTVQLGQGASMKVVGVKRA